MMTFRIRMTSNKNKLMMKILTLFPFQRHQHLNHHRTFMTISFHPTPNKLMHMFNPTYIKYPKQPSNTNGIIGTSMMLLNNKNNNIVNLAISKRFLSFPKMVMTVVRLPVALGASVAGAAAYASVKMEEMKHNLVPDWMKKAYEQSKEYIKNQAGAFENSSRSDQQFSEGDNGSGAPHEGPNAAPAITQHTDNQDEDDDHDSKKDQKKKTEIPRDHALMNLTKKLIEIRNLLKSIDQVSNIKLPNIVVIGSQSSGKSSVLEAIVGHEFLPKGSNMVTRRPIELTLIHTPNSKEEYGEFPQLGLGKLFDFGKIQRTLTDLNLAVPETECVSENPIELKIFSPHVPDLTLIDLPGYIQIHNRNQPAILREKIAELCENYIQEPNIVLAVCAADVDLANSEALRASRRADPTGSRTIGVITKLDLIDPQDGLRLLRDNEYPLKLGYVGVVCKPSGGSKLSLLKPSEDSYFKRHPEYLQKDISVGSQVLRKRLVHVLEHHVGQGLGSIANVVEKEMNEARYQFKVIYNDRRISAESYVAETMDGLKEGFKTFVASFGRPQVREACREMFGKQIVEICQDLYWQHPLWSVFPQTCLQEEPWEDMIDSASSRLTKSGVGRLTTQLVADILLENMEQLTSSAAFKYHKETKEKIMNIANEIVQTKYITTIDQVENTIKPYKFEVELNDQEWGLATKRAVEVLEKEYQKTQDKFKRIQSSVGRRKLRNAIRRAQKMDEQEQQIVVNETVSKISGDRKTDSSDNTLSQNSTKEISEPNHTNSNEEGQEKTGTLTNGNKRTWSQLLIGSKSNSANPSADPTLHDAYHQKLYEKAREGLHLQNMMLHLQTRMNSVLSRTCKTLNNKSCCPEVYLSAISEKLTYTAVMFIWIELLNEFFFQLPRELDSKLFYSLNQQEIRSFAFENPEIQRHLQLQERKEVLESVMEKIKDLQKRSREMNV